MRVTIHMVSAADYPLLAAGVRAARREWWLRATRRRIEPETMAGGPRGRGRCSPTGRCGGPSSSAASS